VPNASTGRKSSRASLQEEILQRRIPETAAAAGSSGGQLLIISKTVAAAAAAGHRAANFLFKMTAAGQFRGRFILNI
jgi:hypothetical protein